MRLKTGDSRSNSASAIALMRWIGWSSGTRLPGVIRVSMVSCWSAVPRIATTSAVAEGVSDEGATVNHRSRDQLQIRSLFSSLLTGRGDRSPGAGDYAQWFLAENVEDDI